MSDDTSVDCTCDVRGPGYDDVTFDDACPYHGDNGTMVAVVKPPPRMDEGSLEAEEAMSSERTEPHPANSFEDGVIVIREPLLVTVKLVTKDGVELTQLAKELGPLKPGDVVHWKYPNDGIRVAMS